MTNLPIPLSLLFWVALAMFVVGAIVAVLLVPSLQEKLIPEWRQALRLDTVQAGAALAFLSVLQAEVLPLVEFAVPPALWPYITGAVGVAIIALRMRPQPALRQPTGQP